MVFSKLGGRAQVFGQVQRIFFFWGVAPSQIYLPPKLHLGGGVFNVYVKTLSIFIFIFRQKADKPTPKHNR